jgi:hypothetical protein
MQVGRERPPEGRAWGEEGGSQVGVAHAPLASDGGSGRLGGSAPAAQSAALCNRAKCNTDSDFRIAPACFRLKANMRVAPCEPHSPGNGAPAFAFPHLVPFSTPAVAAKEEAIRALAIHFTPMLTHVALDTETLFGGGWPHPSVDLENLVAACQALGIPVLLSSVTLTEAETIWLERNGDKLAKARASIIDISRDFEGLLPDVAFPNREALRAAYRAAVEQVRDRWLWQEVPGPQMTAQEIVELSARHAPPFRGKDTGFRDSYMLMSTVLSAGRGSEIGIVTADNGLGDSAAQGAFSTSNGAVVRRFRHAREALDVKRESRNEALQALTAEIARRSERLAEAVRRDRERMIAFVRSNLELPPDVGGPGEGSLQAVRSIDVGDVTEAHAGLPGEDKKTVASVTIQLAMQLEFRAYAWRGPMGLKEGDRDGETRLGTASPRVTVTNKAGQATVDVRATWPEDERQLPQVEYVGVEYGNSSEAITRKLTRLLMERG